MDMDMYHCCGRHPDKPRGWREDGNWHRWPWPKAMGGKMMGSVVSTPKIAIPQRLLLPWPWRYPVTAAFFHRYLGRSFHAWPSPHSLPSTPTSLAKARIMACPFPETVWYDHRKGSRQPCVISTYYTDSRRSQQPCLQGLQFGQVLSPDAFRQTSVKPALHFTKVKAGIQSGLPKRYSVSKRYSGKLWRKPKVCC